MKLYAEYPCSYINRAHVSINVPRDSCRRRRRRRAVCCFSRRTAKVIVANALPRKKLECRALAGTFVAPRDDGDEFAVTGIRRVSEIHEREEKGSARAPRENTGEFNFYVTLHLRSLIPGAIVRLRGRPRRDTRSQDSICGLA